MRSKLILFAAVLVFGVLLISCSGSKNTCPAYGQSDTPQTEQTNS